MANAKGQHNPAPRQTSPLSHPQLDDQRESTLVNDNSFLEAFSPISNQLRTPAGSASSYGQYPPSDYSEFEEDPLYGVDFNNVDAGPTPAFLDEHNEWPPPDFMSENLTFEDAAQTTNISYHSALGADSSYPLTPGRTASIRTISPRSDLLGGHMPPIDTRLTQSISPAVLQRPFQPSSEPAEEAPFAPSMSSANQSAEDLFSSKSGMTLSPKVTVSHWDQDNNAPGHAPDEASDNSPRTFRRRSDEALGRTGLDPDDRPSDEVPSLNEGASKRQEEERNRKIHKWITRDLDPDAEPEQETTENIAETERPHPEGVVEDGVHLGDETENQVQPGQTLYSPDGGEFMDEDYKIVLANRNWADPPMLRNIYRGEPGRYQPDSSQSAVQKFERMCRDNDAASRVATWGTRRRSLPGVVDSDVEEVTSGNILKKLSLTRSGDKSGKSSSIFKEFRDLVRRPSAGGLLKRSRSTNSRPRNQSVVQSPQEITSEFLAPPERTTSGGSKKNNTPSINTALVSMGQASASIGATHSRSGSISGTPVQSPKSPRNSLSVMGSIRRPRSKSDLPKSSPQIFSSESHPNLVGMLAKSGGPPVPSLNRKNNVELDNDDEDDEDELYEDADMKKEANLIDQFAPNFNGFQQHIVTLNPLLAHNNQFLVERIGHQQIIRYKQLLVTKVKHLNMGANCPSGSLCVALGGTANILDHKPGGKGLDALAATLEDDDDEMGPTEGIISQESFPQDIPMPPTRYLPAEFECQLCFQKKKFQKPSDWTKHVHEDVQPFTCTWERCRDSKIFKRKADWVRHENEGHRQTEWWTCDVDECRHTCYRRDNFLQHLVREHKLPEPKIKTKAAMKKAGGMDPTWQKVEQCHFETPLRPQEEPCRFCGKSFPTWKKLTVHLAKHMEQITLPVLRLVAAKAKELAADTIISPVQDPPPRASELFAQPGQFPTMTDVQNPGLGLEFGQGQGHGHGFPQRGGPMFGQGQEMFNVYPDFRSDQQGQPYFSPHLDGVGATLQQPPMPGATTPHNYGNMYQEGMAAGGGGQGVYEQVSPYMGMQADSGAGMEHFQQMNNPLGLQNMPATSMPPQQMIYNNGGIMDPGSGSGGISSPFSAQGSASPFDQSPHYTKGTQNQGWGNNQGKRYMF